MGVQTISETGANEVQHLQGMALGRDAVFGVPDDTVAVDDEGGAHQAHLAYPVLLLLLNDVIGTADLSIHVGEQLDLEAVFVAKGLVAETVVSTDTHDFRPGLLEVIPE